MKKFLILYMSPTSARDLMASATPEQAQAGVDDWMGWAKKARHAIVDLGAPLADVGGVRGNVTGFSILQANSAKEVEELLKEHPHRKLPGASFEIHEFLDMPGAVGQTAARELQHTR
jgi:hypothetical protein